jgi:hypothetical protein
VSALQLRQIQELHKCAIGSPTEEELNKAWKLFDNDIYSSKDGAKRFANYLISFL